MDINLSLFLLSGVGISITVILIPGPITAATIAKGYSNRNAGIMIAAGHAVVEIPLIAAIYLGFDCFISAPQVVKAIYIVGALMLFYLGFKMLRNASNVYIKEGGLPTSSLITGIVLTGTNPAFYLWWVFIGMAWIVGATKFGLKGIILFTVLHWLCDLAWCEFLSVGAFKSRHWLSLKAQRIVFRICALVLIGFGAWFGINVFL